MTLDQLRVLIAVAEHLHVTRAARALNITQSAASAAIAALERRHGVVLFHRVGRHIELTEAGAAFVEDARSVIEHAAAAERTLAELAGLERGSLTLYASQTIANYWLPPILVRYRAAYPRIDVRLRIGNTAAVAQAVLNGSADLGFAEGAVDEAALTGEPLAGDSLALVVAPTHPLAAVRQVGRDDILAATWILRERGSGTRTEFADALAKLDIAISDLAVTMELPSNEAVRSAVEAGGAATAISRLVCEASVAGGMLKVVDFPFPSRLFHVLWHRERKTKRAARALIDILPGRLAPRPAISAA